MSEECCLHIQSTEVQINWEYVFMTTTTELVP